jgi:hypothetical protein
VEARREGSEKTLWDCRGLVWGWVGELSWGAWLWRRDEPGVVEQTVLLLLLVARRGTAGHRPRGTSGGRLLMLVARRRSAGHRHQ